MKETLTVRPLSISRRIYPVLDLPDAPLGIPDAARGSTVRFQIGLRCTSVARAELSATAPDGLDVRIRRIGTVPMPHFNSETDPDPLDLDGIGAVPGLVPDPLFDESALLLGPGESAGFWVSVRIPETLAPGLYPIALRVDWKTGTWRPDREQKPVLRTVRIRVHDLTLAPRTGFHVTQWFYADAIFDRYGTDYSQPRFWELCKAFLTNMAEHGQDSAYVPVFTPPTDGVKRPSQLLGIRPGPRGTYRFDWSLVRRYVRLAKACGLTHFEWTHLFSQWGVRNALRIYKGHGETEELLWPAETEATSDVYRNFLKRFCPAFRSFLEKEGILDVSFFHLSDEPSGPEALQAYRNARTMMREVAPWMKFMDALSEIEYGRELDMPIPVIKTALDFRAAGIESWCYYCCGPRGPYLNRLLDTPAAKILMHGFLFYRWPFKGFLHWGYNFWQKTMSRTMIDPFTVTDGANWPAWAYGDTFLVYPGENGPIDSIRWELFADAMQDFRLLQTLGVSRDDPLLAPIESFRDFPKDPAWRDKARKALFRRANRK